MIPLAFDVRFQYHSVHRPRRPSGRSDPIACPVIAALLGSRAANRSASLLFTKVEISCLSDNVLDRLSGPTQARECQELAVLLDNVSPTSRILCGLLITLKHEEIPIVPDEMNSVRRLELWRLP